MEIPRPVINQEELDNLFPVNMKEYREELGEIEIAELLADIDNNK